MKYKVPLVILIFFIVVSCKNKTQKFAIIKGKKTFFFDTISIGDTVNHIFEIKNVSNKELKISQIGTSCGCTVAKLLDSVISKNETAKIKIEFIAKKDKIGRINNSIVLEANTNPPYTVLYINGFVQNEL